MFGIDVRDFMLWLRDTLTRKTPTNYRYRDIDSIMPSVVSDDQIEEVAREIADLDEQVSQLHELRARARLQRRSYNA
jgi:hypothetical protein